VATRARIEIELPKAFLQEPRFQELLVPRMALIAEALAEEVRKAAPFDRGFLRNSIQSEGPEAGPGGVEARIVVQAFHGRILEEGRRKAPVSREGKARIRNWLERKGVQFKDRRGRSISSERAAFLIARRMGKRKTPARPFLSPTIEKHRRPTTTRLILAVASSIRDWFEGRG
jgi:hypothetical protein